jgi:hypothetical protein
MKEESLIGKQKFRLKGAVLIMVNKDVTKSYFPENYL